MTQRQKTSSMNMTEGNIVRQVILYSLPLMLGNAFQMLYNTADMIVVGNFVGKHALAAVGSVSMVTNMAVFFFNGFSVGASVVIARCFGSGSQKRLHEAIETTMAMTFVICALFTVLGVAGAETMLHVMDTPASLMMDARQYLTVYFWGVSGQLIYNMGSGILRSVGDSKHPLNFLIFTSVLNVMLDLVFVVVFHGGIAGAALATVIAQMISAVLILCMLTNTRDIYRLVWKDLMIDSEILMNIIEVGLPTGIQSVITSFSNVFVQSYINYFGPDVMAGWSAYNKLDQFVMLPMQSLSLAAATFVSQNIGASKTERAESGTAIIVTLAVLAAFLITLPLFLQAPAAVSLFSIDPEVIRYGVMFLRTNGFFLISNMVNHVLAGALRGRGDSRGPMIIMLANFVVLRQAYLFIVTRYVINTPRVVGFGYPVGWVGCCVMELGYYFRTVRKRAEPGTNGNS